MSDGGAEVTKGRLKVMISVGFLMKSYCNLLWKYHHEKNIFFWSDFFSAKFIIGSLRNNRPFVQSLKPRKMKPKKAFLCRICKPEGNEIRGITLYH